MKGIYKVVYTAMTECDSFNDYFYAHDINEIRESLKELFKDFDIGDSFFVDDNVIHASGTIYDLLITIESVVIVENDSLNGIIKNV